MDANPISAGKILPPLDAASPEQVAVRFADLRAQFDQDAASATNESGWKALRDAWVGRKSGLLTQVTDAWLKPAKPELKRALGQSLNELKGHVEAALESRRAAVEAAAESAANAREREDLSLPGVMRALGSRHPLRQTFEEIERIFLSLGYSVVSGPEMETPYYNFEALNIPEHHPARDNMDTFYMATPPGASPLLLRTHTSPMQIRTMEKQPPPVRIIVPGKVYRRDNPDATHWLLHVSPDRRPRGRYRHYVLRLQGHSGIFRARISGTERKNAPAPQLFSVHRAFRRGRCDMRVLRRQRLQRVQAFRLDRIVRRGHGRSRRLRFRELRCEKVFRFCLWPGRGTPDAAEIQHQRFAALFSK